MPDGTPYFKVSISALAHSGTRLAEVAEAIKNGRTFPEVNGAEAYRDVASALGDFKDDWDNAVKRLEDTTNGWGQKLSSISQVKRDHDNELAASYNPSDDGGGGPYRAV
jgi:flagellar basal body rod protein FlgC